MVGFAFIVEGMSVTPRAVLWSGIDLEVEGPSVWGGMSPHHRTELVVIAGNLNAVRHPAMTLQHDNGTSHSARSVHDFLQDRNVSVLFMDSKDPGSQSH